MAKDTQLITPQEKLDALGEFEGRRVIGVGVEMPGAAGGLRDALTVDPIVKHGGDIVYLAMKTKVKKVRFEPVFDEASDEMMWRRVHVLDVLEGIIIEEENVQVMLEAQAIEFERLRGLTRLPFNEADDPDEDDASVAARRAHMAGNHADERKADICPLCQAEENAELEEAGAVGPEL